MKKILLVISLITTFICAFCFLGSASVMTLPWQCQVQTNNASGTDDPVVYDLNFSSRQSYPDLAPEFTFDRYINNSVMGSNIFLFTLSASNSRDYIPEVEKHDTFTGSVVFWVQSLNPITLDKSHIQITYSDGINTFTPEISEESVGQHPKISNMYGVRISWTLDGSTAEDTLYCNLFRWSYSFGGVSSMTNGASVGVSALTYTVDVGDVSILNNVGIFLNSFVVWVGDLVELIVTNYLLLLIVLCLFVTGFLISFLKRIKNNV